MNRFIAFFFSMKFMSLLVLTFFLAIAIATGVETYYDTTTAKYFIYNAKWFEWMFFFLFINLVYNIYRYKMFRIEKIGSLIFHVSFLIIVVGAFVTRNVSFEGIMNIKEGKASNTLLTTNTYFQVHVDDQINQYEPSFEILFSDKLNQAKADFNQKLSGVGLGGLMEDHVSLNMDFHFPDASRPISIRYHDFLPKYYEVDTLESVENGDDFLHIVTVGQGGRKNNYLGDGYDIQEKGIIVTTDTTLLGAIRIFKTDSLDYVFSPFDLNYLQMRDQSSGVIPRDTLVPFYPMRLYELNGVQFVYKQKLKNQKMVKKGELNHPEGHHTIQLEVKEGGTSKIVNISGETGNYPEFNEFSMNGLNYRICLGAKYLTVPFFIHLKDFQLEKYPGTENPSSYASEVTLIDTIKNKKFDHRIFMNHVLDYEGYRFFQSSYDPDESGTILSVNHDWWGTMITYIGYVLMGLGMFLAVFTKGSRFRFLMNKAKDVRQKREKLLKVLILVFGLIPFTSHAVETYTPIDQTQADKFGKLIIQDFGGRFMPVNTMADMILRKVYRGVKYDGMNANQVFVGLHVNFAHWFNAPFIYVSGDSTKKILGIEGKYASMQDFYVDNSAYKLTEFVKNAQTKSPSKRNVFDKNFIKTDERFNIIRGVVMGYYLRIFPMKNDPTNTWYAPADNLTKLTGEDSTFVSGIMNMYIYEANAAQETGDWSATDKVLNLIDTYQRGAGNPDLLPSKSKIDWEIFYTKSNVFERLNNLYLSLGLILLVAQFVNLFRPKIKVGIFNKVATILFILLALAHAFTLGLRWYLSGHAPWSNGYEAIVFISFITVVAGLLFSKNSKIVLGATGILAWLMLFVAHLNNMDPQISNLVPVLKSYWLMIHVAIITGSYGFLGLSAILGIINLNMDIFKTKKSLKRMNLTSKELRYISEMVMTVGLFMLTIGTFLGGVWANESWGRYWGWDAKETWALASVLVYTIILHFRFIPGLKSDFVFNVASMVGYSSIIMTFYGVNFYLSGLHSYATGDPVPIPSWVPITAIGFVLISVLAYFRKKRFS
ncbi:cytochrome c biogenesis protein CcsA [Putridiphycobacter roseus]|nr:cytochrome c biogenesis protein CcsA [Putridiphycobacter roseus]